MSQFSQLALTGKDAAKFLQGQLTLNVNKLTTDFLPCAISNLKGRVDFGLWASRDDKESFSLITASDCMDELISHLKKYSAFSKLSLSAPTLIYPSVENHVAVFVADQSKADFDGWARASIKTGNYWITKPTQGLFQPQELRLHQRGGVDYDKGCYLGQEVIARLYFKASPKAYLHRVLLPKQMGDGEKLGKVQLVNGVITDDGYEALVVGSPDDVAQIGLILPLPTSLMGDVARVK